MAQVGQNDFQWIEVAALRPGHMVRNRFIRVDEIEKLSRFRREFQNTDVFASVCRFQKADRNSQFVCDFLLDIDAEDLEEAKQDALKVYQILFDRLGIDTDSIELAFSGAKGVHIGVPRRVFGMPQGSDQIILWHHLAKRLVKEGLKHIDTGIYQPTRVLRLPNSINSKTGLYKIPLEYKELRDADIADIRKSATIARKWDSIATPVESAKAIRWQLDARNWHKGRQQRQREKKQRRRDAGMGWRVTPCVKAVEAATLPDGVRHTVYYVLARFYTSIHMHPDEAIERLLAIDQRNPICDQDYIERVVRYSRKYAGFRECPIPGLGAYCQPEKCFLAKEAGVCGSTQARVNG